MCCHGEILELIPQPLKAVMLSLPWRSALNREEETLLVPRLCLGTDTRRSPATTAVPGRAWDGAGETLREIELSIAELLSLFLDRHGTLILWERWRETHDGTNYAPISL
jgi:hypothetical protein